MEIVRTAEHVWPTDDEESVIEISLLRSDNTEDTIILSESGVIMVHSIDQLNQLIRGLRAAARKAMWDGEIV